MLDLGCGLGYWRGAARAEWGPRVAYTGVELSEYLCRANGWTRGSVETYGAPDERHDLVVCAGVLEYLDDRAASRAIANIARLAEHAAYVEATTTDDWATRAVRELSDGALKPRPAAWYRRELGKHFIMAGAGLFLKKDRYDAQVDDLQGYRPTGLFAA